MKLIHREDLFSMTTRELEHLRDKILKEWDEFKSEQRLLCIRYEAIENAMKQSDPFGEDFDRLAAKWKEMNDLFDRRFIEEMNYRQSYFNIGYEIDRRKSKSQYHYPL